MLSLICTTGLGPALAPKLLLQFINHGGNILLTLGNVYPIPSAISSLLLELDIHLPPDRTTVVVDHMNHDTLSSSDQHDVLLMPQPSITRRDVRSFFGGDGVIAFPRAVAQALGNHGQLLTRILQAKGTAYTYNTKEEADVVENPFAVGEQITLVSAMQARNSARLTVFGSVEALEDSWFDREVRAFDGPALKTANRDFAKQVSGWTFHEIGVLKVGRVEHQLSTVGHPESSNGNLFQPELLNPTIYRIKNDVTFQLEISEYYFDHFAPLILSDTDAIQLETTMLTPFYRLNLLPAFQTQNSTFFSSAFKLPDQHGIFRFQVNYKRPFLTNVDVKREVTVRHFAHDEWPRSWQISAGNLALV
ncbi:MAG: hypothetical protein Q9163_005953 [Psora crenata]